MLEAEPPRWPYTDRRVCDIERCFDLSDEPIKYPNLAPGSMPVERRYDDRAGRRRLRKRCRVWKDLLSERVECGNREPHNGGAEWAANRFVLDMV